MCLWRLTTQQHEQHKRRHSATLQILAVWRRYRYRKLKLLNTAFFRSSLALHIVLKVRIRRKCSAATTSHMFLLDCSSAKGSVSCVKHYIAGVVKCQKIVRSWLVCRAARTEVSTLHTQYLHFLDELVNVIVTVPLLMSSIGVCSSAPLSCCHIVECCMCW
jgi:hypothetical protein